MDEFVQNAKGQHLCELVGGQFAGREVLMVDREKDPRGGPRTIEKDDILPYVEIQGKHIICGLARYPKAPNELEPDDMLSLHIPGRAVDEIEPGQFRVTMTYARYRFDGMAVLENGQKIPRFGFVKELPVKTFISESELRGMK